MFIYWRASEASETVLGVDNAKSGICYILVVCLSTNGERATTLLLNLILATNTQAIKLKSSFYITMR